ncbi:uncharacterized protein B0I36DRAFT_417155 [Microdochium trichocladiopsis]|uniref:Fungal N-terminal domain-containing protein n=1 Tax=Microdochium trichocladiopsis TaxID=1682393 RepID=A0A9P8XYZ5_9PEZI|nr:uncharacterized protein B0I36DRAFT_417155 [Microdochium trichocladiopsis]KAH7025115.1 hypothetical protein B0I36DRAFT_417155 [Microdochium trichocladiopsis]
MDVAGVALGAISLAIEVTKGIINFTEAVKSKENDLKGLRQKATTLSSTLVLVGQTLQRVQATATNAQAPTTVSLLHATAKSIESCKSDLLDLNQFLFDYTECSSTDADFKEKCLSAWKKLKYGFKHGEVGEMERKLASVNSVLEVGLQSLGLNVIIDQSTSIANAQHEASQAILAKAESHAQSLSQVQSDATEILQTLDTAQTAVDVLGPLLAEVLQSSIPALQTHIETASRDTASNLDAMSSRLESLSLSHHATILTKVDTMMQTQADLLEAISAQPGYASSSSQSARLAMQQLCQQPDLLATSMSSRDSIEATRELTDMETTELYSRSGTRAVCNCRAYRVSHSRQAQRGISRVFMSTGREIIQHSRECSLSTYNRTMETAERAVAFRVRFLNTLIDAAFKFTYGWRGGAGGLNISSKLVMSHSPLALNGVLWVDFHDSPEGNAALDLLLPRYVQSDTANAKLDYRIMLELRPDPLSEAIVLDDAVSVTEMVRCQPYLLGDQAALGHGTHVELALFTGQCFEALVSGLILGEQDGNDLASAKLRGVAEYQNSSGETLAELVLTICSEQMHGRVHELCWCYSHMVQLFKIRCRIRSSRSFFRRILRLVCPPSSECLALYLSELAHRRDHLRDLARRHLSRQEVTEFALNQDAPLDRHTLQVVQHLRNLGIKISSFLTTADDDSDLRPIWHLLFEVVAEASRKGSLHRTHMYSAIASGLRRAGFHDSEAPFSDGSNFLYQLVHVVGQSEENWRYPPWDLLKYAVSGGADWTTTIQSTWNLYCASSKSCKICRATKSKQGVTIAHVLAVGLRYVHAKLGYTVKEPKSRRSLLANISHLTHMDSSLCLCSGTGRTPFMYWLTESLAVLDNGTPWRSPQWLADRLLEMIAEFGTSWNTQHYLAAFRLLTFEALSLEHTCGLTPDDEPPLHDPDNAHDELVESLFHEIVAECYSMIGGRTGYVLAQEKPVEQDLPEEREPGDQDQETGNTPNSDILAGSTFASSDGFSDSARPLWQHWLGVWVTRLNRVLDSLHDQSIRDNHKQAAESIGVVWCEPPPPSPPSGDESVEEQADRSNLEYWLAKLDEI